MTNKEQAIVDKFSPIIEWILWNGIIDEIYQVDNSLSFTERNELATKIYNEILTKITYKMWDKI